MRKSTIIVVTVCVVCVIALLRDYPRIPVPELERRLSIQSVFRSDTEGYAVAAEHRRFSFPDDHGAHPQYRTEWWYYTGNLEGGGGRHFGFQLTYFRTALHPPTRGFERKSSWATTQVYMAHFALTDVEEGRFYAFERFSREGINLAGATVRPFRVWLDDWTVEERAEGGATGLGMAMALKAEEEGIGIDLRLRSEKPAILHGEKGLSKKGTGIENASYYYSLTRLETSGQIDVHGKRFDVEGLAWMDREWSTSFLDDRARGWDWFALQLSDGTELMCYDIRLENGERSPFGGGTFVARDGASVSLRKEDIDVLVLADWVSPRNQIEYPAKWSIRISSLDIDVVVSPHLQDQEMHTLIRYWEGAVGVRGSVRGKRVDGSGYVEMTGYGEKGGEMTSFSGMG